MKKTKLTVNIPEKTLVIDRKSMKLEDSFTDAYVDNADLKEPVLNLKYEGRFSEDDSPIETEMDKLRETYGNDLSKRLDISGTMLEDAHYLSFSGEIEPFIKRPVKKCYDIIY